jgi:hypothetical protein
MTRYALRVDDTQSSIVAALRAAGAIVDVIGKPVDLLVGANGKLMLMECKTPTGKKKPRARGYTGAQEDFLARWHGYPVATVCDVEGALRALAVLRRTK